MDIIKDLLGAPAFWAALLALANTLQRWLLPTAPPEVVSAINAIAVIVFAVIAAHYAQGKAQLRASKNV